MLKPLSKLFIRVGAAAVLWAACAASAAQTTFRFTVMVVGTCEIQSVKAEAVALRCTKNFSPADPHAVPALVGQLPAQPLTLVSAQPAPGGGTLNIYTVSAAQNTEATESGLIAFY